MLNELIDGFINYLSITNRSDETIIGYRKDLTYFRNFAQAKLNCRLYIDDITIELLEEYLSYMKNVKLCRPATISRTVNVLRSFYNYLVKRDLASHNIASLLEPVKLQSKERPYITFSEFETLIANLKNKLVYIVVVTLYYTGLRVNECLTLTIADVDLNAKMIHVISGKGNKDRTVPINDKLYTELVGYTKDRPSFSKTARFFGSSKSGKVSRVYINRELKKAALSSGITKDITCHILRHSFASNLVAKNVNIVHIQRLLGHSSLKVTSIYTHASMTELQNSINML